MTDPDPDAPRPESPFRLNRSRIILLLLVALALVSIVGAIMGGLSGYQELRDAAIQSPGPS